MQQDQVLPLLPILLYALLRPTIHSTTFLKNIMAILAGSALVTIPLLAYFQWQHALVDFWHDAFLFNVNWYTEKMPLRENLFYVHRTMLKTGLVIGFYSAFIASLLALLLSSSNKRLLISEAPGLPAALFQRGVSFQGKL